MTHPRPPTQAEIEKDLALGRALIDLMNRLGGDTPQARLDFMVHVAVAALSGVAAAAGADAVRLIGPRVMKAAIESAERCPMGRLQ